MKNKKRKTSSRWRMDGAYIKLKGEWTYYYRAVDKEGDTVSFMLSKKRDGASARAFLQKLLARMVFLRKPRLIEVV